PGVSNVDACAALRRMAAQGAGKQDGTRFFVPKAILHPDRRALFLLSEAGGCRQRPHGVSARPTPGCHHVWERQALD
ncbi:hypothetical protein DUNSADRAFT_12597, partial [Dunaliella salina]